MNSDIQLVYSKSLPPDFVLYEESATEPVETASLAAPAPLAGILFREFPNPDLAYISTTAKISLADIPNYTTVSSISDGYQTISFSSPMEKIPNLSIWGAPPYTEDATPDVLYSGFSTNRMTWILSRPSKIFGVELMPNRFGTYTYHMDYYTGDALIGSITRTQTVTGPPDTDGARLYAAITDDRGFDRVEIYSSQSTYGFLVAQFRYQSCVKLCNVVMEDTVEKSTKLPVVCDVSLPGFEIIEVSSNIDAVILDTCCDIQEGFVCQDYGLIGGVKAASVRIFAELLIPVTIKSGGCPSITLPYTCRTPVVFSIDNVFVASEIKNCRVISTSLVSGFGFVITPVDPCLPHCRITGSAAISAKIAAGVMTNSVTVTKCP